MKRPPVLPFALVCLFACSDDSTSDGTDTAESTTTMSTGSTETLGEDDFVPVPARGVRLTGVTANHGINVTIANGTEWAGPSDREGRLVTGRDTLFRIYHELDDDYVEHEVLARLDLTLPGGEVQTYTQTKVLVTDTNDAYLEGGLWLAVPEMNGATEPGTKFEVSLWDVGPGGESQTQYDNVAPSDGAKEVGFEYIPMEMNVHYIPFTWNGTTVDITDTERVDKITDEIYQTEPVQTVSVTTGETRQWNGSADVCSMLQTMSQIWASEGAPSNVYYIGLLDTGASFGTMGCALINANFNADVWVHDSIDITATSVVHEIGHNQGLSHVECDDMGNPSAGNDPSYPDHPDGRTLNTGFGIRNYLLYNGEDTLDYMSYCNKRWVSPWTWAKVWTRIQSFTAQGSPIVVEPDPVMHFAMYGNGSESWFTSLARLDPRRAPDAGRVDFLLGGEVIAREPAQIDMLTDDVSSWVTVRMPNRDTEFEFDTIRYIDLATNEVHEARRDEVSFFTQMGPQ